jgi:hypothetical protein
LLDLQQDEHGCPQRTAYFRLPGFAVFRVAGDLLGIGCERRYGFGLLLIVRALYVYWALVDGEIRWDAEHSMDSDITGLYVLVRFYKRHGGSALMATLGNITLAALVFIGSIMSVVR